MAKIPFFHIDAFAAKALMGNQAAIMPLDAFLPTDKMQAIAAENNVAETAFIVPQSESVWDLRWFTPTVEVPLCGHATLAAAHVVFNHLDFQGKEIGFDTKSGRLTVQRSDDGRLEMDFPAYNAKKVAPSDELAGILGCWPQAVYSGPFMLVELERAEDVIDLQIDMAALNNYSLGVPGDRGQIIVSAKSKGEYDVVSRVFVPGVGIPEDPATGSAHCMIAPLFSELLNKKELNCYQAFPGRGADIDTLINEDRVKLLGKAVTVIEGAFNL